MPISAAAYGTRLLRDLGSDLALPELPAATVPHWLELSGAPAGELTATQGPVVAARGCLQALKALAPGANLPGAEVLTRRAELTGLRHRGLTSCGGATRLLPTADGRIAVTLAREADLDLLPALVEAEVDDPWAAVGAWLTSVTTANASERLTLLGLAHGVPDETTRADLPWVITAASPTVDRSRGHPPLVVTFSSLWAGPLCAHLLHRIGCHVVKVEDPTRPDGTRSWSPTFYDELHDGVEVRELSLRDPMVATLAASADIVIEASRPRALRQAGLRAEEHPGTWVSITGHGRTSDRVAYGDDAAVAGGLVRDYGFVGDAVADPLTGVHAALAAWALHCSGGGGRLVDVALARTAAVASGLA